MKQIRKNCFETNSSSTHTLAFSRDCDNIDLKQIIGSSTIIFELKFLSTYYDKYKESEKKDWQSRANLLFFELVSKNNIVNFLIIKDKIIEIFNKRGINVIFKIDKEKLKKEYKDGYFDDIDYYRDGLSIESVYDLENSDEILESNIINFIFSSYYINESFCDEGVTGEYCDKYFEDLENKLNNFPKKFEKFQESYRY